MLCLWVMLKCTCIQQKWRENKIQHRKSYLCTLETGIYWKIIKGYSWLSEINQNVFNERTCNIGMGLFLWCFSQQWYKYACIDSDRMNLNWDFFAGLLSLTYFLSEGFTWRLQQLVTYIVCLQLVTYMYIIISVFLCVSKYVCMYRLR